MVYTCADCKHGTLPEDERNLFQRGGREREREQKREREREMERERERETKQKKEGTNKEVQKEAKQERRKDITKAVPTWLLLGYSLGGRVAMAFADRRDRQVNREKITRAPTDV